jgi:hypothetical protein
MATLSTLTAGAVNSLTHGSGTFTLVGSAPYLGENIAGADDATSYVEAANASALVCHGSWQLDNVDSDLDSMDTLSINVRYKTVAARVDDLSSIEARILTSDRLTVLAGATSTVSTSLQVLVSNPSQASWTNVGATAFSYVNTGATKAQWDAALIEVATTLTKVMSPEACRPQVTALEVTGTYSTAAAGTNAPAENAAVTVTGNNAVALVEPDAENAAVTVTANNATVDTGGPPTNAPAENAAVTVTANQPEAAIGALAENASVSVTANNAKASEVVITSFDDGIPTVTLGTINTGDLVLILAANRSGVSVIGDGITETGSGTYTEEASQDEQLGDPDWRESSSLHSLIAPDGSVDTTPTPAGDAQDAFGAVFSGMDAYDWANREVVNTDDFGASLVTITSPSTSSLSGDYLAIVGVVVKEDNNSPDWTGELLIDGNAADSVVEFGTAGSNHHYLFGVYEGTFSGTITASAGEAGNAIPVAGIYLIVVPKAGVGTEAPAENAAVTVTANQPEASIGAQAENAAVTVTANQPEASIGAPAENAAVTVTGNDATTSIDAQAENATVSVSANDAAAAVDANAGNAAITVTGNDATVDTSADTNAPAENAAVAVTANDATAAVGAAAGNAAVSVSANDATVTIGELGPAEQASISVTANDATAAVGAQAENAAVSVTANQPTVDTSTDANAPAENAAVTVAANNPVVTIAPEAESASIGVTANDATVQIGITAPAENASVSVSGNDASVTIGALAENAAIAVSANDAEVSIDAQAEQASVSVVGNDAMVTIGAQAEQSTISVTANDPTVTIVEDAEAPAENAAITVTANDATVLLQVVDYTLSLTRTLQVDAELTLENQSAVLTLDVDADLTLVRE